jgi:hypothetical protein
MKPKTRKEILALPIGPFVTHVYELTAEDYERGYAIVDGKRKPAIGKCYVRSEMKPIIVFSYEPDDAVFVRDDDGAAWSLGQWADGTYFRQYVTVF